VTGYNNGRQAVVSPKAGTRLTLVFQDGQVSGGSGCNRFHGAYTVEANVLTIHPLTTTRKACEEAVMVQEQKFLAALESAATWEIVNGVLDVHRADGERVLTASADDEFCGIVESHPHGTAGTWTVGGRSIEATEDTDLDEDEGPLEIGACADDPRARHGAAGGGSCRRLSDPGCLYAGLYAEHRRLHRPFLSPLPARGDLR
jgi:hypothetical protein